MQHKKITILAVPGSLRATSSNVKIVKEVQQWAPPHVDFIIYEDLASLPAFDDSDQETEAVTAWRRKLADADGIFVCSPEYAFGIPGALKNAFDWTVRSGDLVNKPLVLVTAASKGDKAHAAWLEIFTVLTAKIPDSGALLVPFIKAKFNEDGEIADTATRDAIQSVLNSLINVIEQSANGEG